MKSERSLGGLKAVLVVTGVVVGGVVAVLWLASSVSPRPNAHGAAESVETLSVEQAVGERSAAIEPEEPRSGTPLAARAETALSSRRANELAEVEATVRAWARAWSDQSVEDYLDFYSVGFEPADGTPLSKWRQERYPRLRDPRRIRVVLGTIDVRMASSDLAIASFKQSYESDIYTDRCHKTLELVREDGVWVIERELAEEL